MVLQVATEWERYGDGECEGHRDYDDSLEALRSAMM
jgi:hypothetical protein